MERIYNKLVRDKIPNIIEEKGETPVIKTLDAIEYKKELEKKLYEEYKEVIEANGEEYIEELADMLEVIRALAKLENKSLDDVILIADKKKKNVVLSIKKFFLKKLLVNNIPNTYKFNSIEQDSNQKIIKQPNKKSSTKEYNKFAKKQTNKSSVYLAFLMC